MRGDVTENARTRVGTAITSKYRLVRLIGCGGMAAVYEGLHRNGHRVAIKMLHPHLSMESDLRTRFLREGYAANRVDHRGAVRVTEDYEADDGSVFLVMELLEGETLDARWERSRRRLPVRDVCELGGQLLDVLAAAHAKGVVHRDIKPENLFLTTDGVLKVLDFGIARLRGVGAPEGATQTGRMIGTPAFMPPEQALGRSQQIDGQTDLWAAGATMFTLASGQYVHVAETMEEMLVSAASRPARPLAAVLSEVPAEVASVVDRALAFEKAQRWPDALAMHEALARAYTAAFGAVLAPTRARTAPPVDAYAATATSTPESSVHDDPHPKQPGVPATAAASATGPAARVSPTVPATVPWSESPMAGKGMSTTAGVASFADPGESAVPLTKRRGSRVPLVLGAAAVVLLGGGALAFTVLRPPSVDRNGAAIAVSQQPASQLPAQTATAAPGETPPKTPTTASGVSGGAPPPTSMTSIGGGNPSEAASPVANHPSPKTPAASPKPTLPTTTAPPQSPTTNAPPPQPPPPVIVPTATATPPPTPSCRSVAHFDNDGHKRFKWECQ